MKRLLIALLMTFFVTSSVNAGTLKEVKDGVVQTLSGTDNSTAESLKDEKSAAKAEAKDSSTRAKEGAEKRSISSAPEGK